MKEETLALLKRDDRSRRPVVYSLAAPRRGAHTSALRPIGKPYTNKTVNFQQRPGIRDDRASRDGRGDQRHRGRDGGEDWQLWMDALRSADLLAPGVMSVAYSYIGSPLMAPIYRKGTIGRAKEHLEATAHSLTRHWLPSAGGRSSR